MMKKIFARRDFFARVTTGFHRHGQARPGHPGLLSYERCKMVDTRIKSGHDARLCWSSGV